LVHFAYKSFSNSFTTPYSTIPKNFVDFHFFFHCCFHFIIHSFIHEISIFLKGSTKISQFFRKGSDRGREAQRTYPTLDSSPEGKAQDPAPIKEKHPGKWNSETSKILNTNINITDSAWHWEYRFFWFVFRTTRLNLRKMMLANFEHRVRLVESAAKLFDEQSIKNKQVAKMIKSCNTFKTYATWPDELAHRMSRLQTIVGYMKTDPSYAKQIYGEAAVNTDCKITEIAFWRSPQWRRPDIRRSECDLTFDAVVTFAVVKALSCAASKSENVLLLGFNIWNELTNVFVKSRARKCRVKAQKLTISGPCEIFLKCVGFLFITFLQQALAKKFSRAGDCHLLCPWRKPNVRCHRRVTIFGAFREYYYILVI